MGILDLHVKRTCVCKQKHNYILEQEEKHFDFQKAMHGRAGQFCWRVNVNVPQNSAVSLSRNTFHSELPNFPVHHKRLHLHPRTKNKIISF